MLAGSVGRAVGSRVRLQLHGQAQLMLYENTHAYRAGSRFAGGLAARGRVTNALAASVSADVVNEQRERWDGEVLQDGNLGRTDVLVGAGVTYRIGAFGVALSIKVPVYRDIIQRGTEAGQLSYPAIVDLTIDRTFDLLAR